MFPMRIMDFILQKIHHSKPDEMDKVAMRVVRKKKKSKWPAAGTITEEAHGIDQVDNGNQNEDSGKLLEQRYTQCLF